MYGSIFMSFLAVAGVSVSAVPAKRQEGPLVYAQGSRDQAGAVQPSSTFNTQDLGCWQDNYPFTRILNGTFFFEPVYTTPETCSKYCASLGYIYSGTEAAFQCFCGNGLSGSQEIDASQCSSSCLADSSKVCGGNNALSVQKISYAYNQGCFEDQINYRALDGAFTESNSMTVQKCAAFCTEGGFAFAGLEYGSQCFCGQQLRLGPAPSSQCNMPCAGDSQQVCGAGNTLSVYSLNGATIQTEGSTASTLGCFRDYWPQSRTFTGPNVRNGGNTNAICQNFCTSQGFPYSGTEYSNECYCSMNAPTVTSEDCSMSCAGNESEICGGVNALTVTYFGK